MKKSEMNRNKKRKDVEDEVWRLTPWGCLFAVLNDYNIYCDHITSRMGEHLVDDFMEAMEKHGYLSRVSEEE